MENLNRSQSLKHIRKLKMYYGNVWPYFKHCESWNKIQRNWSPSPIITKF